MDNLYTVWIVTELFAPNESATAYIMTKIARHLAESNKVKVICADSNYERDSNRVEQTTKPDERIEVIRVPIADIDKNNLFKRLIRLFSASHKLYKVLKLHLSDGDVVLTVTNPALFLLYIARLRKRRSFNYYLIVHDIFPENMIPAGIIKENFLYRMIKRTFDKAYSFADKLVVLGEDMRQIVAAKIGDEKKVSIVENWGDLKITPRYADQEKIIVQYAGNLGRVQGVFILLDLINQVDNKMVAFEFWGSGALTNQIKDYISEKRLNNVCLCGSFSRSEQEKILGRCDIAIVTLAKGMKGLGVPSKSYNILAAGKPVLFVGDLDSEIALMVEKHEIGWAFDPSDTIGVLNFLNGLGSQIERSVICQMGKKARLVCEQYYSEPIIMDKYDVLIKKSNL